MDYKQIKQELVDTYDEENYLHMHRVRIAEEFIDQMGFKAGDIIMIDGDDYELSMIEYNAPLNIFEIKACRIYPEGIPRFGTLEIHSLNIERVLNAKLVRKGDEKN